MKYKENRKMMRLKLQESLRVSVASIGSPLTYCLITKDVSLHGFFLEFDSPARFPFLSSSILEVWLEIPNKDRLYFMGKIARVVHSVESQGDLKKGIAISIIQIEADTKAALSSFLDEQYKAFQCDVEDQEQPSLAGAA